MFYKLPIIPQEFMKKHIIQELLDEEKTYESDNEIIEYDFISNAVVTIINVHDTFHIT